MKAFMFVSREFHVEFESQALHDLDALGSVLDEPGDEGAAG